MRARMRLDRSGAAAVEYAIILPALLILLFGIIDGGRVMWTQVTLDRAVEAAARCAAINATVCGSTALLQTYAADQAFGMTVDPSAFALTTPSCGHNVTATLPFTFVIPWIGSSAITLSASACYP